MCVAVPMQITTILGSGPLAMATVDGPLGAEQCSLAYVPEATVGDFVMIQAGFAMTVMDAAEAHESLAAFTELLGAIPTDRTRSAHPQSPRTT